jgi:hypothetical protein
MLYFISRQLSEVLYNVGDENFEIKLTTFPCRSKFKKMGKEQGRNEERIKGMKGIEERKKEDKGRRCERNHSPLNFNGFLPLI